METQTITQTINILVDGGVSPGAPSVTAGNLANTGSSLTALSIVGLVLVIASIILWRLAKRRNFKYRASSRNFGIFTVLAFTALGLGMNANLLKSSASPMPPLALSANQSNLDVTVPKGGGTATTTTSLTTRTQNSSGYKLTAQLTAPEPGIAIALKGGAVTTSTPLAANATPLELKTTNTSTTNDTIDTTEVTLTFTIDGTVTSGTKELKLNYTITDNQPIILPTPTTMQSMTNAYCNSMEVYDGSNEYAVISLADNRGFATQNYQVAKLADNNCWMLTNLKLGNSEGPITLTPADTNIASNFELPQVVASGTADPDNPGVYGSVPGNTNSGATNYGYLYNWSAATAGESRTTHDQNAGDAPYSICPLNWRLPTGGVDGDFSILDIAFGGSGADSSNGEPNIAKWQFTGPFKGTLAGYWQGSFGGQGVGGNLRSSSADPSNVDDAMSAYFNSGEINPVSGVYRDAGVGVRCLLNVN